MKTQSTYQPGTNDWDFTAITGDWEIKRRLYIIPYLQSFSYDAPGTTPAVNPIPGLEEAPPYSGGSGTSGDPYQIANTDDLIELSNTSDDWGDYFIQTANIDFGADETAVDWDGDGSASWDAEDQLGFHRLGIALQNLQVPTMAMRKPSVIYLSTGSLQMISDCLVI